MAKLKFKWNSEKMVSLSAMSISFITLLIFIYQTNLMRKQNELAIMPYLGLSTTNDTGTSTFELNLLNHGVGPAIIESVTMEYQGRKYDLREFENSFFNFLKSKRSALYSIGVISTSTLDRGMAIPANTSYNIFSIRNSAEGYQLIVEGLDSLLQTGFKYEIVYKNINGDRWKLFNDSEGPQKL
jgi:hypothetical protein